MLDKSKHASQVRRLLRILDADALKATVSTATKGKVEVTSEIAAIDVILKYTPDLEKLFSYQRITSDVLFKYLSQLQVKNKKIELTRRTKKHEMVSIIKDIWKKNAVETQTPKKNKKVDGAQKTKKIQEQRGIDMYFTNYIGHSLFGAEDLSSPSTSTSYEDSHN